MNLYTARIVNASLNVAGMAGQAESIEPEVESRPAHTSTPNRQRVALVAFLIWLASAAGLFMAMNAEAYEQTDDGTATASQTAGQAIQLLGTGLTGSVGTTSLRGNITGWSNVANDVVIQLFEYSNSTYTTFTNGTSCVAVVDVAGTSQWGSPQWYTCNLSFTFNASRYYALTVGASGPGFPTFTAQYYGSSNSASYPGGLATSTLSSFGGVQVLPGSVADYAFYIGTNPPPEDTSTRVENYQPFGTTTATTTVTISTDYYINSFDYPELNGQTWEVCLTGGALEGGPIILADGTEPARTYEHCEDATMDALDSVATTTLLQASAWQGYAVIRNASTTQTLIAKPYRFVVVTSNIITEWPVPGGTASTTGGVATFCGTQVVDEAGGFLDWTIQKFVEGLRMPICWAIDGFQGMMVYLWYPTDESLDKFGTLTLDNRFPFEYLYQSGDIFADLYSTDNGDDFTVSASTTLGTITFISPAMIEQWQPIPSFIKIIVTGIIWYMLMMYLYYKVLRIHDK